MTNTRTPRIKLLWLWAAMALAPAALVPAVTLADGEAPAKNETTAAAKQVINDAIERALRVLRDEELKKDPPKRMEKLRAAVDHVFDWEAMAKSSIGPHWRNLNERQRTEFVGVFKELLARQYMDDIDRFQGSEKLRVTGAEPRGGQSLVKTVLITASREEVPIDYTMHKPEGQWRVEDLSIEGVSMVNHYRKTFTRFLVNSDFDTLMKRLKRKLGSA